MSRARRGNRDAAKAVNEAFEVPKMPDTKEKFYTFHIQGPMGVAALKLPHSGMKRCPCGSIYFKTSQMIAFVKNAADLKAEPACFKVEVNLCEKCGREPTPEDDTIGGTQPAAAEGNGKLADKPSRLILDG